MRDAEKIIGNKKFYEYAKEVGTPTTRNSYRLSVLDIMAYPIDSYTSKEIAIDE